MFFQLPCVSAVLCDVWEVMLSISGIDRTSDGPDKRHHLTGELPVAKVARCHGLQGLEKILVQKQLYYKSNIY